MTKMIRSVTLLLIAITVPGVALGKTKPPRPLFADDSPLHLALRGPLGAIGGSKVALPATLSVVDTKAETLSVQISARGITRRKHEVCPFPPIRVDFPTRPGPDSLFAKQRSLKLVTHCQLGLGFQQYQLLEYAAYKIYALLTPKSFDTRLATIDYLDKNGHPIVTRTGFFIEDIDDVARRNGTEAYKTTTTRIGAAYLGPSEAARDALFQFMIGNLDWAMNAGPAGANCCHNTKLMGVHNVFGGLVPVPYDYDFSGLVDAPYATPPEGIDTSNVRQRLYRGFCRTNTETTELAADFLAKRVAILSVLDTVPGLEERSRRKAQAYLATFFDQISKPAGVSRMLATCIG